MTQTETPQPSDAQAVEIDLDELAEQLLAATASRITAAACVYPAWVAGDALQAIQLGMDAIAALRSERRRREALSETLGSIHVHACACGGRDMDEVRIMAREALEFDGSQP